MFGKTRMKIVATVMAVFLSVWVGSLSVIYASSYIEMTRQNKSMLKEHTEMYSLPLFDGSPPPEHAHENKNREPSREFSDMPVFKLSTFYTVALSADGETLEIRNDKPNVHSDTELEALAKQVSYGEKQYGKCEDMTYYSVDKGGYLLVAFMDNTVINENAARLLRYTFIFGGIAVVAIFIIAVVSAKRIVRPLEESYLKQKQFISDAGHELKTPISVVGTSLELLEREIGDNRWLSNIQYENERMSALVTQLLELARAESSCGTTETVDLTRLCNGELLAFESLAFEQNINIKSQLTPNVTVDGNSTQLKQLVSVLLDNALSHGDKDGDIVFNLTVRRNMAVISVKNKGKPIPPEQLEKIFGRFYRADTVRNGEDGHYGLGLSIAEAVVKAHKGNISAESSDGYVEFKAELPLKNHTASI